VKCKFTFFRKELEEERQWRSQVDEGEQRVSAVIQQATKGKEGCPANDFKAHTYDQKTMICSGCGHQKERRVTKHYSSIRKKPTKLKKFSSKEK